MAYNFPLPPLLLEAVVTSRADILNTWIYNWPVLPENTTLFNFTASHDGVGLRPLEGLMNEDRIKQLLINCEKRGGLISPPLFSQLINSCLILSSFIKPSKGLKPTPSCEAVKLKSVVFSGSIGQL